MTKFIVSQIYVANFLHIFEFYSLRPILTFRRHRSKIKLLAIIIKKNFLRIWIRQIFQLKVRRNALSFYKISRQKTSIIRRITFNTSYVKKQKEVESNIITIE